MIMFLDLSHACHSSTFEGESTRKPQWKPDLPRRFSCNTSVSLPERIRATPFLRSLLSRPRTSWYHSTDFSRSRTFSPTWRIPELVIEPGRRSFGVLRLITLVLLNGICCL